MNEAQKMTARTLRETGIVVRIHANSAFVAIQREKKCIGCKHCITARDGKHMIAKAVNMLHAKTGDSVIIESGAINQISDGFLLFILPLLFIAIGIITGNLTGSIIAGFLTGLALLLALFLFFRLKKDKYQMKVVKILPGHEPSEGQETI